MLNNEFSFSVVFEGGEGVGKTSLINKTKEFLEEKGFEVMVTREPGGVEIAEQIRSIILNKENTEMDGRTEALLYAAARRQHLVQKVFPALKEGKVVVLDRFLDSSLAYQGHARGIGIDEVMSINEFAIEDFVPNLTLLLDLEPEIGLKRINDNKEREVNRLDLEKLDFHHKVREGYLKLAKMFPERIRKIDASKSLEEVFESIKLILEQKI